MVWPNSAEEEQESINAQAEYELSQREQPVPLLRYNIGDCEMLRSANGKWIPIENLKTILEWLTDNDARDVFLYKLEYLREATA